MYVKLIKVLEILEEIIKTKARDLVVNIKVNIKMDLNDVIYLIIVYRLFMYILYL